MNNENAINSDYLASILEGMAAKAGDVLPKIFTSIIILLIGYFLAKFLAYVLKKFLTKIKINRLAKSLNEIEFIRKSNFEFNFAKIISKTIYYLIMLFFGLAATDVLGMAAISNMVADFINYIPSLLTGVLVLIIGLLISNLIQGIATTTLKSLNIPSAKMIGSIIFYFLFITVVMSAMQQAKIDSSFLNSNIMLVIGGGVFAFAFGYGLASKDLISNYLGNLYSSDKIEIGDIIQIGKHKGEIINKDNKSITIKNEDKEILIPLNKLTKDYLIKFKND